MKILVIIFCFPFYSKGQATFTGTVSDKNTAAKIPYASVALMKEDIGFNADENGNFTLVSFNKKTNDSIVVSSVGYETRKIAVNDLPEKTGINFELLEKHIPLTDVLVTNKKKWEHATLKPFGNCGTDYLSAQAFIAQVAQLFHADTTDFFVSEVEICKYAIALIDPDKSIFRLRKYGIDSLTGGPSIDLTDSVIEVKSAARRVRVSLDKYKIYISEHDFFVAIEWLKIPQNASTEKIKVNGERMRFTDYGPLICHRRFPNFSSRTSEWVPEVWEKNYKGKWSPMPGIDRLMIETKIKY